MSEKLTFDQFVTEYEDCLHRAYMESGAYYDTDIEVFQEIQYEDYLTGRGLWRRSPKSEKSTPAKGS